MKDLRQPPIFNIFIGTEPRQYIPQRVLEYSIYRNSTSQVETHPVQQRYPRVGGTRFSFVRFSVPSLMQFQNRAIYLDADQIVLSDLVNLFEELPETYSVGLVQTPVGNFGDKPVGHGNQTSVMILDCRNLFDWKVPELFSNVVPNRSKLKQGQIHYRDFMSLSWYDQTKLFPINPAWNHFNIVRSDTRIVHFSHVRSQPWTNPTHELSDWWNGWLLDSVKEGYLSRARLWYEAQQGNIDRKFIVRAR